MYLNLVVTATASPVAQQQASNPGDSASPLGLHGIASQARSAPESSQPWPSTQGSQAPWPASNSTSQADLHRSSYRVISQLATSFCKSGLSNSIGSWRSTDLLHHGLVGYSTN